MNSSKVVLVPNSASTPTKSIRLPRLLSTDDNSGVELASLRPQEDVDGENVDPNVEVVDFASQDPGLRKKNGVSGHRRTFSRGDTVSEVYGQDETAQLDMFLSKKKLDTNAMSTYAINNSNDVKMALNIDTSTNENDIPITIIPGVLDQYTNTQEEVVLNDTPLKQKKAGDMVAPSPFTLPGPSDIIGNNGSSQHLYRGTPRGSVSQLHSNTLMSNNSSVNTVSTPNGVVDVIRQTDLTPFMSPTDASVTMAPFTPTPNETGGSRRFQRWQRAMASQMSMPQSEEPLEDVLLEEEDSEQDSYGNNNNMNSSNPSRSDSADDTMQAQEEASPSFADTPTLLDIPYPQEIVSRQDTKGLLHIHTEQASRDDNSAHNAQQKVEYHDNERQTFSSPFVNATPSLKFSPRSVKRASITRNTNDLDAVSQIFSPAFTPSQGQKSPRQSGHGNTAPHSSSQDEESVTVLLTSSNTPESLPTLQPDEVYVHWSDNPLPFLDLIAWCRDPPKDTLLPSIFVEEDRDVIEYTTNPIHRHRWSQVEYWISEMDEYNNMRNKKNRFRTNSHSDGADKDPHDINGMRGNEREKASIDLLPSLDSLPLTIDDTPDDHRNDHNAISSSIYDASTIIPPPPPPPYHTNTTNTDTNNTNNTRNKTNNEEPQVLKPNISHLNLDYTDSHHSSDRIPPPPPLPVQLPTPQTPPLRVGFGGSSALHSHNSYQHSTSSNTNHNNYTYTAMHTSDGKLLFFIPGHTQPHALQHHLDEDHEEEDPNVKHTTTFRPHETPILRQNKTSLRAIARTPKVHTPISRVNSDISHHSTYDNRPHNDNHHSVHPYYGNNNVVLLQHIIHPQHHTTNHAAPTKQYRSGRFLIIDPSRSGSTTETSNTHYVYVKNVVDDEDDFFPHQLSSLLLPELSASAPSFSVSQCKQPPLPIHHITPKYGKTQYTSLKYATSDAQLYDSCAPGGGQSVTYSERRSNNHHYTTKRMHMHDYIAKPLTPFTNVSDICEKKNHHTNCPTMDLPLPPITNNHTSQNKEYIPPMISLPSIPLPGIPASNANNPNNTKNTNTTLLPKLKILSSPTSLPALPQQSPALHMQYSGSHVGSQYNINETLPPYARPTITQPLIHPSDIFITDDTASSIASTSLVSTTDMNDQAAQPDIVQPYQEEESQSSTSEGCEEQNAPTHVSIAKSDTTNTILKSKKNKNTTDTIDKRTTKAASVHTKTTTVNTTNNDENVDDSNVITNAIDATNHTKDHVTKDTHQEEHPFFESPASSIFQEPLSSPPAVPAAPPVFFASTDSEEQARQKSVDYYESSIIPFLPPTPRVDKSTSVKSVTKKEAPKEVPKDVGKVVSNNLRMKEVVIHTPIKGIREVVNQAMQPVCVGTSMNGSGSSSNNNDSMSHMLDTKNSLLEQLQMMTQQHQYMLATTPSNTTTSNNMVFSPMYTQPSVYNYLAPYLLQPPQQQQQQQQPQQQPPQDITQQYQSYPPYQQQQPSPHILRGNNMTNINDTMNSNSNSNAFCISDTSLNSTKLEDIHCKTLVHLAGLYKNHLQPNTSASTNNNNNTTYIPVQTVTHTHCLQPLPTLQPSPYRPPPTPQPTPQPQYAMQQITTTTSINQLACQSPVTATFLYNDTNSGYNASNYQHPQIYSSNSHIHKHNNNNNNNLNSSNTVPLAATTEVSALPSSQANTSALPTNCNLDDKYNNNAANTDFTFTRSFEFPHIPTSLHRTASNTYSQGSGSASSEWETLTATNQSTTQSGRFTVTDVDLTAVPKPKISTITIPDIGIATGKQKLPLLKQETSIAEITLMSPKLEADNQNNTEASSPFLLQPRRSTVDDEQHDEKYDLDDDEKSGYYPQDEHEKEVDKSYLASPQFSSLYSNDDINISSIQKSGNKYENQVNNDSNDEDNGYDSNNEDKIPLNLKQSVATSATVDDSITSDSGNNDKSVDNENVDSSGSEYNVVTDTTTNNRDINVEDDSGSDGNYSGRNINVNKNSLQDSDLSPSTSRMPKTVLPSIALPFVDTTSANINNTNTTNTTNTTKTSNDSNNTNTTNTDTTNTTNTDTTKTSDATNNTNTTNTTNSANNTNNTNTDNAANTKTTSNNTNTTNSENAANNNNNKNTPPTSLPDINSVPPAISTNHTNTNANVNTTPVSSATNLNTNTNASVISSSSSSGSKPTLHVTIYSPSASEQGGLNNIVHLGETTLGTPIPGSINSPFLQTTGDHPLLEMSKSCRKRRLLQPSRQQLQLESPCLTNHTTGTNLTGITTYNGSNYNAATCGILYTPRNYSPAVSDSFSFWSLSSVPLKKKTKRMLRSMPLFALPLGRHSSRRTWGFLPPTIDTPKTAMQVQPSPRSKMQQESPAPPKNTSPTFYDIALNDAPEDKMEIPLSYLMKQYQNVRQGRKYNDHHKKKGTGKNGASTSHNDKSNTPGKKHQNKNNTNKKHY